MIRRFFYHAFWNFYDYLGTLTLIGAGHAITALGFAALLSIFIHDSVGFGVAGLSIMVLSQYAFAVIVLSALMPFCARAARGEPARFPHLLDGFKSNWKTVALISAVWTVVMVLLVVNFFFYLRINEQVKSQAFQVGLVIISAAVGWFGLAWIYFATPWLSAATAGNVAPFKQTIAKGMMSIALLPGVWLWVLALLLIIFITGIYTRIGLIFLLPFLASAGQTAYFLSLQLAGFLTDARQELGDSKPLRHYKQRARELAWEWEYRQPRRTLKELIKPWEY